MAKQITGKKPKNMKKTIRTFLRYLGNHKFALLLVGVLVIASAGANLYGTYLLNPLIDNYILPHDYDGLVRAVLFMGLICRRSFMHSGIQTADDTYGAEHC